MSGFHKAFSLKNIKVDYTGLSINDAFAEDAAIDISENSPYAEYRTGLSGKTSVALSADNSYKVTLTVFPESTVAKALTAGYQYLKKEQKFIDNGVLNIKDPSGAIVFGVNQASLENMGDRSFNKNTGTMTFVFFIPDLSVIDSSLDLLTKAELGKVINA